MFIGGVQTSCPGRVRSHSKREMSRRSKMAISPSRISAGRLGSVTAFRSSGKRCLWSRPFRLVSGTWLPTFAASQPSYVSSQTRLSDERVLVARWRASAPGLRLVEAIDEAHNQRTVGGSRVSTGTLGHRPKGMSRPLEAAPSGSPTGVDAGGPDEQHTDA
jgi:hypothetical protein